MLIDGMSGTVRLLGFLPNNIQESTLLYHACALAKNMEYCTRTAPYSTSGEWSPFLPLPLFPSLFSWTFFNAHYTYTSLMSWVTEGECEIGFSTLFTPSLPYKNNIQFKWSLLLIETSVNSVHTHPALPGTLLVTQCIIILYPLYN